MKQLSVTNIPPQEDGTCVTLYVYEMSVEESNELEDMFDRNSWDEVLEVFGVCEEHFVAPGAPFHRYDIHRGTNYAILEETIALNV